MNFENHPLNFLIFRSLEEDGFYVNG